MHDDNALYAQLLEIRDNIAMIKEVKFIISLIKPQFDFRYLDKAFRVEPNGVLNYQF